MPYTSHSHDPVDHLVALQQDQSWEDSSSELVSSVTQLPFAPVNDVSDSPPSYTAPCCGDDYDIGPVGSTTYYPPDNDPGAWPVTHTGSKVYNTTYSPTSAEEPFRESMSSTEGYKVDGTGSQNQGKKRLREGSPPGTDHSYQPGLQSDAGRSLGAKKGWRQKMRDGVDVFYWEPLIEACRGDSEASPVVKGCNTHLSNFDKMLKHMKEKHGDENFNGKTVGAHIYDLSREGYTHPKDNVKAGDRFLALLFARMYPNTVIPYLRFTFDENGIKDECPAPTIDTVLPLPLETLKIIFPPSPGKPTEKTRPGHLTTDDNSASLHHSTLESHRKLPTSTSGTAPQPYPVDPMGDPIYNILSQFWKSMHASLSKRYEVIEGEQTKRTHVDKQSLDQFTKNAHYYEIATWVRKQLHDISIEENQHFMNAIQAFKQFFYHYCEENNQGYETVAPTNNGAGRPQA